MWRARCATGALLSAALAGACSAAPSQPSNAPVASAQSAAPKTDARSRLQGTWELVTFVSLGPVPDEAVPVLASLHGAVRMRFEPDSLTTFIPGNADQETCPFEIAEETGEAFTLVTNAGMFRRAKVRFLSTDSWEATEDGPTWPGTTRFQRVVK